MSSGIAKASRHRGSVSNISLVSRLCDGRPRVRYGEILACATNYTIMSIALCFCDGVQLTQMFCMHVFAEGCTLVSYDIKLFDLFLAS